MKKVLTTLTVLAFVFIASSAMAGGVKMPKLLCLYDSSGSHQLAFKSMGSITNESGKVTTYTISGISYNSYYFPVTGSAFIVPGTTTLRATFTSMCGGTARKVAYYELSYNLANNSGTIQYRFDFPNGTIVPGSNSVTGGDCSMMEEPTAMNDDE